MDAYIRGYFGMFVVLKGPDLGLLPSLTSTSEAPSASQSVCTAVWPGILFVGSGICICIELVEIFS